MKLGDAVRTALQAADVKRLVVYSYRPAGATKQHRFALAKGDAPGDVLSTHGTRETAAKAAKKLSDKLGGVPFTIEA